MNEVKIEFDYCGLCPYLGELILIDDLNSQKDEDYKIIIYCKDYHGIARFEFGRELSKEEYDNIPDWCPQLPFKEDKK